MDDLDALLCTAIVPSLGKQERREAVAGYALVFDADMTSIYGASVRHSDVEADDPVLFSPVDWPTEHHSPEFGRVGEHLSHLRGGSYDDRVATLASSMKTALERARGRDEALAEAVLLVTCADGGSVWDRVEDEVARELNDSAVYERWRSSRDL